MHKTRTDTLKTLTLFCLEVGFILIVLLVGVFYPIKMPDLWVLPFLILATLRLAVTISENEIMEWIRKPFTTTCADSCGVGDSVEPKGVGVVRAIGGLLACPICTGTWSALALVVLYSLAPGIGTVLILVLGAAGGSELLYYQREQASWSGRLARVQCGQYSKEGAK